MNLLTDEVNQAYMRGYEDGKAIEQGCIIHGLKFYARFNGCMQCMRDAKVASSIEPDVKT